MDKRSFAWYSTQAHDWYASSGDYDIMIGSSSRDIHLVKTVSYKAKKLLPLTISEDTALGDLIRDERTSKLILSVINKNRNLIDSGGESSREAISEEMTYQMNEANPLRNLRAWYNVSDAEYKVIMKKLKEAAKSSSK